MGAKDPAQKEENSFFLGNKELKLDGPV